MEQTENSTASTWTPPAWWGKSHDDIVALLASASEDDREWHDACEFAHSLGWWPLRA